MSRLTASPFHKPAPFEFPRPVLPLSPPETNADYVGPTHPVTMSTPVGRGQEDRIDSSSLSPPTEPISSRYRKGSAISYHNSGIRESRERTVQRSLKSLIVVIPPSILLEEHGQLGHTLASGPRHRLAHGILMPLFPTIYGQLTAIAREFNFPSTAGLCLYLQYTDAGITITPRISDDTWQHMWGHVFDARSPSNQLSSMQLPIRGRVEFDIDLRQARWYSAWIVSSRKDSIDVPSSAIPAFPHSIMHSHANSRSSFAEDPDNIDDTSVVNPLHVSDLPARHLPKKLSLVDRFDALSARSVSRPNSRMSPPDQVGPSYALSPIAQEEEPKTATLELEKRVKSWRAGALLPPTPLLSKNQMNLEYANMPNPDLDHRPPPVTDELNLDDFAWSISSAGPGDYDPESPLSFDYVPSVHLANRVKGSVCMTPSICTSFGPLRSDIHSPATSSFRLPSPDLGQRMLEDCPPTPSTATSWGAPLSCPPSPISDYRVPSVGIGERSVFSRPVTPATATSWGPSFQSVSSVESECRPRSIHLGEHGDYSRPLTPDYTHASNTNPQTLNSPNSLRSHYSMESTPWNHVWPYHQNRPLSLQEPPMTDESQPSTPWAHVWPHRVAGPKESQPQVNTPWTHVWPYHDAGLKVPQPQVNTPWAHVWPYHVTSSMEPKSQVNTSWTHVWPYHHLGCSSRNPSPISVQTPSRYPYINIYQATYPYFDLYPAPPAGVLGAMIYPNFNLYPDTSSQRIEDISAGTSENPFIIKPSAAYPMFDIYPSIYPGNLEQIYHPISLSDPTVDSPIVPYPSIVEMSSPPRPTTKTSQYPDFDLYPAVSVQAPATRSLEVYPTVRKSQNDFVQAMSISVQLRTYPVFNLYPPLYPVFDLYPAVPSCQKNTDTEYPELFIYPNTQTSKVDHSPMPLSVHSGISYPTFQLYPPMYPEFEIYPALPEDLQGFTHKLLYPDFEIYSAMPVVPHAQLSRGYPTFNIYPAVYPHFDLYPKISFAEHQVAEYTTAYYPTYPFVYPNFDLYPAPPIVKEPSFGRDHINSQIDYPLFNLYPAVYPHFDLYLPVQPSIPAQNSQVDRVQIIYPVFNLYPAIYPHFDLYPPTESVIEPMAAIVVKVPAKYPAFDLYPVVYPHFELWPSILQMESPSSLQSKLDSLVIKPSTTPPQLHDGFADSIVSAPQGNKYLLRKVSRSHLELHQSVFPTGVVSTPSAPQRRRELPPIPSRLSTGSVSVKPPPPVIPPRKPLAGSSTTILGTAIPVVPPSNETSLAKPRSVLSSPPDSVKSSSVIPLEFESPASRRSQLNGRGLPPIGDRRSIPSPSSEDTISARSSFIVSPSKSVVESTTSDGTHALFSLGAPRSHVSTPRKRDSLVLQRVRALNSSIDETHAPSTTMEALSQFPLPPRPLIPPLPTVSKLDHSKFPFA